MCMEFEKLVLNTLEENNVAGGAGSAFGPNVVQTATPKSGDNLASRDARNVFGAMRPGVLTRSGMRGKKSKNRRRRKK